MSIQTLPWSPTLLQSYSKRGRTHARQSYLRYFYLAQSQNVMNVSYTHGGRGPPFTHQQGTPVYGEPGKGSEPNHRGS